MCCAIGVDASCTQKSERKRGHRRKNENQAGFRAIDVLPDVRFGVPRSTSIILPLPNRGPACTQHRLYETWTNLVYSGVGWCVDARGGLIHPLQRCCLRLLLLLLLLLLTGESCGGVLFDILLELYRRQGHTPKRCSMKSSPRQKSCARFKARPYTTR